MKQKIVLPYSISILIIGVSLLVNQAETVFSSSLSLTYSVFLYIYPDDRHVGSTAKP
jgi:hypothetical protein